MRATAVDVFKKKGVVVQKHNVIAYGHLPKTVFMTRDFNREVENVIGEAQVYIEDNVIKADLDIFANVKKLGKLYPAIGGIVHKKNESGEITEAEITEVSLCTVENADPTILPLEDLP